MCLCYLFSAKTAWQLVNRKTDFYQKTNRFESRIGMLYSVACVHLSCYRWTPWHYSSDFLSSFVTTNISCRVANWPVRQNRAVDRAWRPVVERRSSEILSTQLTDDGPVYHALSVLHCGAKLITRFDDRYHPDSRYALANFSKSRVWSIKPAQFIHPFR